MKTKKKTDSSLPEINVVSSWNGLTRPQLLFISGLFQQKMEQYQFKVIALNKLAGIKITGNHYVEDLTDRYFFEVKYKKQKFFVTAGLYKELLTAISFVTEQVNLTKQIITRLWLGRYYYGPDSSLYNITYNELIHAQLACTNFGNTKNPVYLDTLAAVLYRKQKPGIDKNNPKWDGDLREEFSAYTYQRRARRFRFLPFKLKYAIYMFVMGSLNQMAEEHPLCFKSSTRVSSSPKKENPAKLLIDLVPVINKGDPTKNIELYRTPAWEVFDAYERFREEQEAGKKK